MIAQFQRLYPTGCLTTELLTIYQGKFIVRASVQVEGVTRSTGMAIAETLELAEDRARERALSVLLAAPEPALEQTDVPIAPPTETESSVFSDRTIAVDDDFSRQPPLELEVEPATSNFSDYPEFAPTDISDRFSLTAPDADVDSSAATKFSNVKPFVPRSNKEEIAEKLDFAEAEIKLGASEPVDLSDTLAAIETALKSLRWTGEQERKYLKRTYGQESRDTLTTQQLFEFLSYLEVFAQTTKELDRLGWTNQQGQEYLLQTYNKRSRQYLSERELKEFLQYLQAEPSLR